MGRREKSKHVFEFDASDWLSDPDLSMCVPSTRGIWMDAICVMIKAGRTGRIESQLILLAKKCRSSLGEFKAAVADLRTNGAAEAYLLSSSGVVSLDGSAITKLDGSAEVALVNRRMQREYEERQAKNRRALESKHRKRQRVGSAQGSASGSAAAAQHTPSPPPPPSPSLSPITPLSSSPPLSAPPPTARGVGDGGKAEREAAARSFAVNWITVNCPSFLRAGPAAFARLVLRLGKERAVALVEEARADANVGNPFAYVEAKLDNEHAKSKAPVSSAVVLGRHVS